MAIKINCKICNKEFKTYPSKILLGRGKYCSVECAKVTYFKKGNHSLTEFKKGMKIPIEWRLNWKKRKPWNKDTKGLCKSNSGTWKSGQHSSPNTEFKSGQYVLDKHFNWQGGKSFEPYPLGWTKTHREQIRYRDGYRCQVCGVSETEHIRKLSVHHIDYDKNNLQENNLITLCGKCHLQTNYNRKSWQGKLKAVMPIAQRDGIYIN